MVSSLVDVRFPTITRKNRKRIHCRKKLSLCLPESLFQKLQLTKFILKNIIYILKISFWKFCCKKVILKNISYILTISFLNIISKIIFKISVLEISFQKAYFKNSQKLRISNSINTFINKKVKCSF